MFQCSHESHRYFNGRVSVYHVLKEKKCYPQGCLSFFGFCSLLQKGKRCVHRFHSTGRKCKGCTHLIEEKIHQQPRLLLSEDEYETFLEELSDFENWLTEIQYRPMEISGRISIIKPWFEQNILNHQRKTFLKGFLLILKRGFIGLASFEDTIYIRVSHFQMQTHQFLPKMKIECVGDVRVDHGRLVIHKPRKFDIIKRGWGRPMTKAEALVSIKTATHLKDQPEKCLDCRWGALVDVTENWDGEKTSYRRLYCLKSVVQPEGCYLFVKQKRKRKKISNKNISKKN